METECNVNGGRTCAETEAKNRKERSRDREATEYKSTTENMFVFQMGFDKLVSGCMDEN
jgi:hypothetical protein